MFSNYLKIAARNLKRRPLYTVVTLTGLTLGITFVLLIGNYLLGEFSVNRTLRNVDRQFLLQSEWKEENMGLAFTTLSPLGPTLKAQYPNQVKNFYRYYGATGTISSGDRHFRESIQIGDPSFLSMFGFPLELGEAGTALSAPNSVVLTSTMAEKLFGRKDVLNQSLTIQTPRKGRQDFKVTGILADVPRNSVTGLLDNPDQVFLPMANVDLFIPEGAMDSWLNQYIPTYLELTPGTTVKQVNAAIAQVLARSAPENFRGKLKGYISPLTDYYLEANNGLVEKLILALTAIGVFILLMAIVNFVNITIGMAGARSREIGVRKVLGGLKLQLKIQMLSESLLLATMAAFLALFLYEMFRPDFGEALARTLPSVVDWPLPVFAFLVAVTLLVSLLAGLYPAFILSSLPSVESLKGKITSSARNGAGFRKTLIAFQFTVATFVFIGAVVIKGQVSYFFAKDLGYKKDLILTISSLPRDWSPAGVQKMEASRDRLKTIRGVSEVSLSFEIPDGKSSGVVQIYRQGTDSTQAKVATLITTDENMSSAYNIPVVSGQFFKKYTAEMNPDEVVLNESAVKALGWKQPSDAIGRFVRFPGSSAPAPVGGVVRDFHFGSLREQVGPVLFSHVKANPIYRYFTFRLSSGEQLPEVIARIETEWKKNFPDAPFEYSFMDDTLAKLYQTELQLQKAARLATTLALIIVLLGVFGLVSLNVSQRTKEIGIRKTLGASVLSVLTLFLKDFVGILIVANLIAWPLAYYFLDAWLSHFAYRISLSWLNFGAVTVALAVLTALVICAQSIRAALANPVDSLRNE